MLMQHYLLLTLQYRPPICKSLIFKSVFMQRFSKSQSLLCLIPIFYLLICKLDIWKIRLCANKYASKNYFGLLICKFHSIIFCQFSTLIIQSHHRNDLSDWYLFWTIEDFITQSRCKTQTTITSFVLNLISCINDCFSMLCVLIHNDTGLNAFLFFFVLSGESNNKICFYEKLAYMKFFTPQEQFAYKQRALYFHDWAVFSLICCNVNSCVCVTQGLLFHVINWIIIGYREIYIMNLIWCHVAYKPLVVRIMCLSMYWLHTKSYDEIEFVRRWSLWLSSLFCKT